MLFKSSKLFFGLLVIIFIFYNYDYPKEAFDNFMKKYNLNQYSDFTTGILNMMKISAIKNFKDYLDKDKYRANLSKNNTNNQVEQEEATNLGNEDEIFCNKKSNLNIDNSYKLQCALNFKDKSVSFLKPVNQIPYNYTDKLDNNVLYSLTPGYTSQKIKHEKEIKEAVTSYNSKIIHSNFDKNIDNYKKSRQVNTILNIRRKNVDYKPCFVKTPENIQKELKLFTRILRDKIVINWNIPILPKGYIPKEIIIKFSKNKNFEKSEIYSIDYTESACNYENELFNITTLVREDRVIYNLTSSKKNWFNQRRNCFIINCKVYFLFEFFDKNRVLQNCMIESNVSTLLKN